MVGRGQTSWSCAVASDGHHKVAPRSACAPTQGRRGELSCERSPKKKFIPLDFSKDGKEVFLRSSVGRDTMCVVAMDIESGREREIAAMDGFDAEEVLIHPVRRDLDAVAFAPERRKWIVSNVALRADFEALARIDDGDLSVVSRDLSLPKTPNARKSLAF